MRRLISYTSLVDGSLTIDDIALLNDAISVEDENHRRYQESVKNER
jgi:hypothetical protein